jgi:UDP-N-acetylglucosamine--N-acetylmuramyl-(pentapeptide) pyrophosphoryl-undecaprenol N-acetylglucosamine transferase
LNTALRLLFAGGGTGGHLYPALAIADEIRRRLPSAAIMFAGTSGKIEARVVPARGYPLATIWISGFHRGFSPANAIFPLKAVVSLVQSFLLVKRYRPDAVIGTGGYVSGPVVCAAQMLGLPTLLQEQNSVPGVTTRLLAPRAREVHLAFEGSRRYLRRADNTMVSGNPTRDAIGTLTRKEGAEFFGIDPAGPALLVFGGSLGAASINSAMREIAPRLSASGVQIIWQTGSEDFSRIQSSMPQGNGSIRVYPFIDRMEAAYAACDLAVCRSGAGTLAELARAGVPAILVPLPGAAAGHQMENALSIAAAGGAAVLADDTLVDQLELRIRELMNDPSRRQGMRQAIRLQGHPEATRILADAVIRLAKRDAP